MVAQGCGLRPLGPKVKGNDYGSTECFLDERQLENELESCKFNAEILKL